MSYAVSEQNPLLGLPLAFGILLSLVVHFAVFFAFVSTPKFQEESPFIANVTFEVPKTDVAKTLANADKKEQELAAEAALKRQIVSSPDNQKEELPPDFKPKQVFESDRDALTAHEQIKRGDTKDAGVPGAPGEAVKTEAKNEKAPGKKNVKEPPASGEPQKQTVEKSTAKEKGPPEVPAEPDAFSSATRPLRQLKLDDSTVYQKFAMNEPKQPSLNERLRGQAANQDLSAYQPFSRPMGSGARFLGQSGVNDYLPNLPDGDITLLNTKANKFAVFVSRVATQVFSQMRARGLDSISNQEIVKAGDNNIVRVRLSTKGELLDVKLEKGSGSGRFDEVLMNSARLGAKDPNPPADAVASDGTIHFIFQSKIWGQAGNDPRSGMPFRQIWLLLATGLE